jgi:lipopolysaccharide transport system permease protein
MSETIRNHLGMLWLVLDPVLRMFVYYFVFVYLIRRRTEDFTSFLLIGIMAFTWFSKTIVQGGNSITAAGRLMKQIHLPKIIFPTISSLVRTVEFTMVFGVLLSYFALKGNLYLSWVALPAIFLAQFLLSYGVALTTAGIMPFIPDISFIISSAMTALFFLSGVFFEVKPSHPNYNLFMVNPIAKLLEQYRQVILHGHFPEWDALIKIGAIGIILILVMSLFIKKMDFYFPRVVK